MSFEVSGVGADLGSFRTLFLAALGVEFMARVVTVPDHLHTLCSRNYDKQVCPDRIITLPSGLQIMILRAARQTRSRSAMA